MKTFLVITALFVLAVSACNNKSSSAATEAPKRDSTYSSLADLASSTDVKKLLCQDWENKEDAADAALSGGGEGLEMTYRGFSFFEDGSLVENPRDKINFGKWSMNDANKLIDIVLNNGEKTRYKIVAIGPKQMILMSAKDKKKVEYKADGKMYKEPAEDPFYGINNQWRIKPAKSESDSMIKLRTEQCILFFSKFLADNAARGKNTISFAGLPGCFKWYRGGVSVTTKTNLPANWLNCYYNKEQALKAQEMIEKIISKKYKWDKGEKRWVKQSAGVVRQMYDTLKLLSVSQ